MFWSHFQDIFQMIILKEWIPESVFWFRDWANSYKNNHYLIYGVYYLKITSVEILKSSDTYNFAWQKSGVAMAPRPPQFCRACNSITSCSGIYPASTTTSIIKGWQLVGFIDYIHFIITQKRFKRLSLFLSVNELHQSIDLLLLSELKMVRSCVFFDALEAIRSNRWTGHLSEGGE